MTDETPTPDDDTTPGIDFDELDAEESSLQTVTNDAVAGETVTPGVGEHNDGPTGGSPKEGTPYTAEQTSEERTVDYGDDQVSSL